MGEVMTDLATDDAVDVEVECELATVERASDESSGVDSTTDD
jgi:hypothetical protein